MVETTGSTPTSKSHDFLTTDWLILKRRIKRRTTSTHFYLCLDHVVAFIPHLEDIIKGVYHLLLPCPLELNVDGDETACSTHPSTAVDQDWRLVAVRVRVMVCSLFPSETRAASSVTMKLPRRPCTGWRTRTAPQTMQSCKRFEMLSLRSKRSTKLGRLVVKRNGKAAWNQWVSVWWF